MSLGILGNKIGMTQVFTPKGEVIPVTIIKGGPCYVTQIKSKENCGYNAIQLGYFEVSPNSKSLTKAELGHFNKASLSPYRYLKEYKSNELSEYVLGQKFSVEMFEVGQKVNITGFTIGKGFTGNIKRHGFHRGAMTHGSKHHRAQGSLGSVMGEKFCRAIDYCIENRLPFMCISKSGGARMMESAFSLMQLPKTCGKLSELSDAQLPYISLLTDPTFGGISASFGMLGDLNIAEPGALIGFAGPRVIKETIKRDLPEGFQTSEFLLEHGFLDFIVDRKSLKDKIYQLIVLFKG